MTYGLGFNSPVKLNLGKDNYDALIDRHGQYVRWRTAIKCSCLTGESGQPDIRCKFCQGTGMIYGFQKEEHRTATIPVEKDGSITLSERSDGNVRAVYLNGVSIPFAKYGKFVKFPGTRIKSDEYVSVETTFSRTSLIASAGMVSLGGEFYRVTGCRAAPSSIGSVTYTAPGDVLSCSVSDDEKEFTVMEFRMDMVRVKLVDDLGNSIPIVGSLKAKNVVWIAPIKFLILSQGFNEVDSKMIETAGGDAVLTAPYCCDIGEGDVITVLSGSMMAKEVLTRKGGAEDTISAFFVDSIERIFTTGKEYEQGVDYILAGTNRIVWLANAPEAESSYSILYRAFPTYTIVRNMPSLRTSENQRMPRRAVIKLFAAFKEGRRVNQND